jgi:hypothetical protein
MTSVVFSPRIADEQPPARRAPTLLQRFRALFFKQRTVDTVRLLEYAAKTRPPPPPYLDAQEDESTQDQATQCVTCKDHRSNVVMEPCNHLCMCRTCIKDDRFRALMLCPMCRGKVQTLLRVYQ